VIEGGNIVEKPLQEFSVTDLQAQVVEGVVVQWQSQKLNSGPLNIELDKTTATGNRGVLDYGKGRVNANFQVFLAFPEFASILETLGVDPDLTQPVHAVINSEGQILDEHGFRLSGPCTLADHALLGSERTEASILPGT
jgi:hypothetical protein